MIIDSNIIIYSINSDSPKFETAREFLLKTKDLYFTHQSMLESMRVLTHPKFARPMKSKVALKEVEKRIDLGRMVSPKEITYTILIELIKKHELTSDVVFDAYLVATALSNDIDTIATDNEKDFDKFEEIKVYNPFTQ